MNDKDGDGIASDVAMRKYSRRKFLGLAGSTLGSLVVSSTGLSSALLAAGLDRPRRRPGEKRRLTSPTFSNVTELVNKFSDDVPFSFSYADQASSQFLMSWNHSRVKRSVDAKQIQYTHQWQDPDTGLEVKAVVTAYQDFPTVEWTLYFTNAGTHATPMIGNVLAIDATVNAGTAHRNSILHTFNGSTATVGDYGVYELTLKPGKLQIFTCVGGRSTNGALVNQSGPCLVGGFPYFNVDGGSSGVIASLAWPGQWAMEITATTNGSVYLGGGMSSLIPENFESVQTMANTALTNLYLDPGETFRTPRIVLQFWQGGDWIDAQNVWRRWMLAHNVPHVNGQVPGPMSETGGVTGYYPGMLDTAQDELSYMAVDVAGGITGATGGPCKWWWIDAGWYDTSIAWSNTGTWEPDPTRYPHGLRPVTNEARKDDMQTIVWFEVERATPGTWLYENHRDWLIGPNPLTGGGPSVLLNLGNPTALAWLIHHITGLIKSQGIDLYRRDFNFNPVYLWNMNDPPQRSGWTQAKYVEGYLAYQDALRATFPQMLIDNCASGGRRNDLESLKQAIILLRSDDAGVAIDEQCHMYGISFWLPCNGTAGGNVESIIYRSQMGWSFGIMPPPDCNSWGKDSPYWALLDQMGHEWSQIADNYLGDYYPLTPYSQEIYAWMAWQFNRSDLGRGLIQAFRRPLAVNDSLQVKLRGLESDEWYRLTNVGSGASKRILGRTLQTQGLSIPIPSQAGGASILVYEKT